MSLTTMLSEIDQVLSRNVKGVLEEVKKLPETQQVEALKMVKSLCLTGLAVSDTLDTLKDTLQLEQPTIRGSSCIDSIVIN
jgi:hypothetical protein